MVYSYPLWLLIFLILPLALLWKFKYRTLIKYKLVLTLTTLGSLVVSIPWDILSVNDRLWYFSVPHILGVWLLGLPVEEYIYISGVALLASGLAVILWERYGVKE